jgi:hypothetical protein
MDNKITKLKLGYKNAPRQPGDELQSIMVQNCNEPEKTFDNYCS